MGKVVEGGKIPKLLFIEGGKSNPRPTKG